MWLLLLLWGAFLFCAIGAFFDFEAFIIPAIIIPVFIYFYAAARMIDSKSEIKTPAVKFFLWLLAPLLMPYILIAFDRLEQSPQGAVQSESSGKLPEFVSDIEPSETKGHQKGQEKSGKRILLFVVIGIAVLIYGFNQWSDSKLKKISFTNTTYSGNRNAIGFAGIAFNSIQPRHDHYKNCETTLTHETLYYFKPKKNFSVLNEYYYLLDKAGRVCEIWAIKEKSSIDDFYKVHSEIEYLYKGYFSDQNDERSLKHKIFYLDNAAVTLRLTHGNQLLLKFQKM